MASTVQAGDHAGVRVDPGAPRDSPPTKTGSATGWSATSMAALSPSTSKDVTRLPRLVDARRWPTGGIVDEATDVGAAAPPAETGRRQVDVAAGVRRAPVIVTVPAAVDASGATGGEGEGDSRRARSVDAHRQVRGGRRGARAERRRGPPCAGAHRHRARPRARATAPDPGPARRRRRSSAGPGAGWAVPRPRGEGARPISSRELPVHAGSQAATAPIREASTAMRPPLAPRSLATAASAWVPLGSAARTASSRAPAEYDRTWSTSHPPTSAGRASSRFVEATAQPSTANTVRPTASESRTIVRRPLGRRAMLRRGDERGDVARPTRAGHLARGPGAGAPRGRRAGPIVSAMRTGVSRARASGAAAPGAGRCRRQQGDRERVDWRRTATSRARRPPVRRSCSMTGAVRMRRDASVAATTPPRKPTASAISTDGVMVVSVPGAMQRRR